LVFSNTYPRKELIMAQITDIHVTACDNELYILASTGRESSELCHIKSGFGDRVDYRFNPQHILPVGTYDLTLVGINWGGPSTFSVTTTPGGTVTSTPSTAVGVVWQHTIPGLNVPV
jgi:hypothetical protein